MRVTLDIWRQDGPNAKGRFERHVVEDAEPEWSILELLDRLNDQIVENDGDPIVFESDCREGVCGCCGFVVNGKPHGPLPNTPACRQHLRAFPEITHFKIEPFRSAAFPVIRDLAIDRSNLDRLVQAGGTVDVRTGTPPDAPRLRLLHRMRSLRGRLPERCCHAFRRCETLAPGDDAAGSSGALEASASHGQCPRREFRPLFPLRGMRRGLPGEHPVGCRRPGQSGALACRVPWGAQQGQLIGKVG